MTSDNQRRRLLQWLGASSGLAVLAPQARAQSKDPDLFGEPEHRIVYQFNKADVEYMEHVLFSVGALLRKYPDKIHIVVTAFGPGIHILARHPRRPVPEIIRQRVASLADYGVSFHACGNTLKSLGWDKSDLLDFAELVDIGADDLMTLQEQGYSYISW